MSIVFQPEQVVALLEAAHQPDDVGDDVLDAWLADLSYDLTDDDLAEDDLAEADFHWDESKVNRNAAGEFTTKSGKNTHRAGKLANRLVHRFGAEVSRFNTPEGREALQTLRDVIRARRENGGKWTKALRTRAIRARSFLSSGAHVTNRDIHRSMRGEKSVGGAVLWRDRAMREADDEVDVAIALRMREADDHFYGPWFGGSAKGGGGPGRGATPEARRADLAAKVGTENVGNPNPTAANATDKPPLPTNGAAQTTTSEKAEGKSESDKSTAGEHGWGAGPTVGPEQAYKDSLAGGSPNVKPNDVGKFMDIARAGEGHPDLTKVQVDGTMSFGGNGLGIKRIDMPQLPGDQLPTFLDQMRAKGIKVTEEKVRPGSLQPIQSEVSAKKCGGMLQAMREGTLPGGAIVITGDGFVLDGHHRWGAGTAYGFEKAGVTLDAIRIGMPARELLPVALAFTREQGIQNRGIAESIAIFEAAWEVWDARNGIREASGDDHFYGAWKGGAAAGGGRPMTKAEAAAPNKDELPRPPGYYRKEGPRIRIAAGDPRKGGPEDPRQTHYRYSAAGHWVQRGDHKEWEVTEWKQDRVDSVHKPYLDAVIAGNLPKRSTPTVYMTGGGPASGKSTGLLENPLTRIPTKAKAAHIDPDSAKTHIPEFTKGKKRGDKTAANTVHEESSHLAKVGVATALGRHHDVVYDSVGDTGIVKLEKKVNQFRAQGGPGTVVRAEYATIPVAVALERARVRETTKVWPDGKKNPDYGRHVKPSTITDAHRDVSQTYQAAVERGTFDHARLWDTNVPKGTPPNLIATYDKAKGGLTVHNQKAWDAFKAIGATP